MVSLVKGYSRYIVLSVLLSVGLGFWLAGCGGGGSAAPSGGGGTPVAVELPAIQMPATISANLSGFSGDLSAPIGLMKAISDPSFLTSVVPSSIDDASFAQDNIDETLAAFAGGTCSRSNADSATSATTTQCTYTNSSGQVVKFDFSEITDAATLFAFSHNGTNQNCNLTCVANNTIAPDATHSLCMRVWLDGVRYLIGKFNTVPTAEFTNSSGTTTARDKGAGCFIALRGTEAFPLQAGSIYDNSTATAAAATPPNTYSEMFLYINTFAEGDHLFVTQSGTSTSSYLLNFNFAAQADSNPDPLYATMRWPLDVDLVYGNYQQGSQSTDSSVCTDKSGNLTSGCNSTGSANTLASDLTTPALGAYFDLATSADYTLPPVAVFPTSPTF